MDIKKALLVRNLVLQDVEGIEKDVIQRAYDKKIKEKYAKELTKEFQNAIQFLPEDIIITDQGIKVNEDKIKKAMEILKEKEVEKAKQELFEKFKQQIKKKYGIDITWSDVTIEVNNNKINISLNDLGKEKIKQAELEKLKQQKIKEYIQEIKNKYGVSLTEKDLTVNIEGDQIKIQLNNSGKEKVKQFLINKNKEIATKKAQDDLNKLIQEYKRQGINLSSSDFSIEYSPDYSSYTIKLKESGKNKIKQYIETKKKEAIEKAKKEYAQKLSNQYGIKITPDMIIYDDKKQELKLDLSKVKNQIKVIENPPVPESIRNFHYPTKREIIDNLTKMDYVEYVQDLGNRIVVKYKGNPREYIYRVDNFDGYLVIAGLFEDKGAIRTAALKKIYEDLDFYELNTIADLYDSRFEDDVSSSSWRKEYWFSYESKGKYDRVDRWDRIRKKEYMLKKVEDALKEISEAKDLGSLDQAAERYYQTLINSMVKYTKLTGDTYYLDRNIFTDLRYLDSLIPDNLRNSPFLSLFVDENKLKEIENVRQRLLNKLYNQAKLLAGSISRDKAKELQKRLKEYINKAQNAKDKADLYHYLSKAEKINKKLASINPDLAYSKSELKLMVSAPVIEKIDKFNQTENLEEKKKIIEEIKKIPASSLIVDNTKIQKLEKNINLELEQQKIQKALPKNALEYEKYFQQFASPEMKKIFDVKAKDEKTLELTKKQVVLLPSIEKSKLNKEEVMKSLNKQLVKQSQELLPKEGTKIIKPPILQQKQTLKVPKEVIIKDIGKQITGGFTSGVIQSHYIPGVVAAKIIKNPKEGTKEAVKGTLEYFDDLISNLNLKNTANFLGWAAGEILPTSKISNLVAGATYLVVNPLEARIKARQELLLKSKTKEGKGKFEGITKEDVIERIRKDIETYKEKAVQHYMKAFNDLKKKVENELKEGKITDNYVKLMEYADILERAGIKIRGTKQTITKTEHIKLLQPSKEKTKQIETPKLTIQPKLKFSKLETPKIETKQEKLILPKLKEEKLQYGKEASLLFPMIKENTKQQEFNVNANMIPKSMKTLSNQIYKSPKKNKRNY
jgi:hypothetical protein